VVRSVFGGRILWEGMSIEKCEEEVADTGCVVVGFTEVACSEAEAEAVYFGYGWDTDLGQRSRQTVSDDNLRRPLLDRASRWVDLGQRSRRVKNRVEWNRRSGRSDQD